MKRYPHTSLMRSFQHDCSASVLILAAFLLPVSVGCAALAVDLGWAYLERRQLQGAVDLAALAAASDLDLAQQSAEKSLTANRLLAGSRMIVTKGQYSGTLSTPVAQRFQPNVEPFNAVRVDAYRSAPLFFSR